MLKIIGLLTMCAMVCCLALNSFAQCTPPLFQGWPSSCSVINLRWLNRDNHTLIERYEIYIGSQLRGTRPGSALSFSDPVGCGFGANYIIKQVMKSGATCQTLTTGGPHTAPCNLCGASANSGASIVNSANFRQGVSRNSLASIFPDAGQSFTNAPAYATSLPLPTSLGGVTVSIEGRLCEIVAVVPATATTSSQINFYLPSDLDSGPTETTAIILTTTGTSPQYIGKPQLNPNAPGIFTLASNGTGPAASNWLIVKPNGQQIWQNAGALSYNSQDQVFLVLYGTGINESVAELRVTTGVFRALYSGNSWMTGVQQIVIPIPIISLQTWPALVSGTVRIGQPEFSFESQGFEIRR
jgi:uncharacterized protein (TIGR03437 family)